MYPWGWGGYVVCVLHDIAHFILDRLPKAMQTVFADQATRLFFCAQLCLKKLNRFSIYKEISKNRSGGNDKYLNYNFFVNDGVDVSGIR